MQYFYSRLLPGCYSAPCHVCQAGAIAGRTNGEIGQSPSQLWFASLAAGMLVMDH